MVFFYVHKYGNVVALVVAPGVCVVCVCVCVCVSSFVLLIFFSGRVFAPDLLRQLLHQQQVVRIRDQLSEEFARLCYNGFW